MATIQANDFTQFELTPEELRAGQMLTVAQVWNLQNYLAQVATQKVNLKYNPEKPLEFVQQEAELQGQINVLRTLLNESITAINEYNNVVSASQESPQESQADQIFPPVK